MSINLTDFNFVGKNIYNTLINDGFINHTIYDLPIKYNGVVKSFCFFIKEVDDIVDNSDDDSIDKTELNALKNDNIEYQNKIVELDNKVVVYRDILATILNSGEVSDETVDRLVEVGLLTKSYISKYE